MTAEILQRAWASTSGVLAQVQAPDLDRPTPCALWTVRDLINHIVGGAASLAEVAETGSVNTASSAGSNDGKGRAYADEDFRLTFDLEAARAVAAVGAPGALDRVLKLPFGEMPAAVFVWIAAGDTFTHGWDLAKAIGLSTDLDPPLARELLIQIEPLLPESWRGPEGKAPFGPKVEAPENAPAADRLAAFQGRHL